MRVRDYENSLTFSDYKAGDSRIYYCNACQTSVLVLYVLNEKCSTRPKDALGPQGLPQAA